MSECNGSHEEFIHVANVKLESSVQEDGTVDCSVEEDGGYCPMNGTTVGSAHQSVVSPPEPAFPNTMRTAITSDERATSVQKNQNQSPEQDSDSQTSKEYTSSIFQGNANVGSGPTSVPTIPDPCHYSDPLSVDSSNTRENCNTHYGVDTRMNSGLLTSMPKSRDTKPVLYSERLSGKSPGTQGNTSPMYTAGNTGVEVSTVSMCYETAPASVGEEDKFISTSGEVTGMADFQANTGNSSAISKHCGSANGRTSDAISGTRYQHEPGESTRDDIDVKPYAVAYMCDTEIELNTNRANVYSIEPYATRYQDEPTEDRSSDAEDIEPYLVTNMSEIEVGRNKAIFGETQSPPEDHTTIDITASTGNNIQDQLRPNILYAPNDMNRKQVLVVTVRKHRWGIFVGVSSALVIVIIVGVLMCLSVNFSKVDDSSGMSTSSERPTETDEGTNRHAVISTRGPAGLSTDEMEVIQPATNTTEVQVHFSSDIQQENDQSSDPERELRVDLQQFLTRTTLNIPRLVHNCSFTLNRTYQQGYGGRVT
ncbi:hypothetical protein Bbelb_413140 [Branchiostoma belcheri]|nr:hypothetical protein Bbelb_413140 [Branchiostoma belcheri]